MQFTIEELLRKMVEAGASDLHIKAGSCPGFRVDGSIAPQEDYGRLSPEQTLALATQLMDEEQRAEFEAEGDLDFSHAVKDCARFRVNVLTQRGSAGMVIRQIADSIPNIDDLKLPEVCKTLALKPRGLVLVTGPTGSGKSTTLAAMIDYVNANESGHILTMEDPLEFIHKDKQCFVNQRQIGTDCKSFGQALRRALRQDPDVILIGEMRDLETISLAITAAETGHLVFGTLHTTSAISTMDRIIDVFPTDQQEQVRVQLSSTIQGVISQCLLKKIGGGRVAAHEIMVATDGIRSLIREGKTSQMLNFLQTGKKVGMMSLEQRLVELVNQGVVTLEDAVGKANRPDDVSRNAKPPAGGARQTAQPGMQGGAEGMGRRAAPEAQPTTARPAGGTSAGLARRGGSLFGKKS